MQGLKKVLVGMAIFAYIPLCAIVAGSFAINRTITNQSYVKDTLLESGFYEAAAGQIRITFEKNTDGEDVPNQVKTALNKTLGAESLQATIEPVIETAYEVLDNPDAVLTKTIDLKPLKQSFSRSLKAEITKRANKLPVCTLANPPKTNDPFTINCIPPGTDINASIDEAVDETLQTKGVPADTVSIAELLEENSSGKSIIAQASSVYRLTKLSIFVALVLLGIATTVILTLSKTIRGGVHRVTTLLLTTAILLAGTSWLILFVLGRVTFVSEQAVSIESSLGSALRLFSLDVFRVVMWFSVVYGIIGIALLIGLYSTEKKKRKTV